MHDFYEFRDLKLGMRINVEGTFGDDGTLRARGIAIKDDSDAHEIESTVQSVDLGSRTLRLLGATLHVTEALEIKDLDKRDVGLEALVPGTRIKTKGRMLDGRRFAPDKIKIKDRTPDAMDEIEGEITGLDPAARAITVLGFRVGCDEDVEIEA